MTSNQSHKRHKTFFAITSLQSHDSSQLLASGYQKSKAEAVDQALNVAGKK
jgi:hypothetical protein